MRPSLLPGLLAAVQRNRNRGFADVGLFEVGPGLSRRRARGSVHRRLRRARRRRARSTGAGRHWAGAAPDAGLFDAKADVVALLAALGFDAAKAQMTREAPAWFHPGPLGGAEARPQDRARPLRRGASRDAARAGCRRPGRRLRGVPRRAAAAEAQGRWPRPPLEAADLLPVRRDFAFVLDADGAGRRRGARRAWRADKKLIAGVSVFDVFEGESLGAGQEVAGAGGDAAAEREDADRRGDRGRRRQDRRRGEARRRAARSASLTAVSRQPLSTRLPAAWRCSR